MSDLRTLTALTRLGVMLGALMGAPVTPALAQSMPAPYGGAPAVPAMPFGWPAPGAGAAVDPFSQWAMAMLGPALQAANPQLYGQWMNMMANPFVDLGTKHQVLGAMMQAFDPQVMFGRPPAGPGGVAPSLPLVHLPGFPTQSLQRHVPNTVMPGVSREARRRAFQTAMLMSPLSMRDMIGIMAEKMPVNDDVSFEDAVDSMKLRANEINFKLVGHNALWLDVRAITGDEDTRRVEIFQFCDAMVARKILDVVPEFVVFLPCRIALLEDAERKLWVMTLDWDIEWMDYAQNPNNQLAADLRADAKRIRDGIRYIMEGAASGDF